ncbi:hypothetical protein GVN18_19210 [Pseudomonas sp. ODNR1LW]|nr:hypothetical protein [Pseudomonas sp. ODNR1LW]
MKRRINAMVFLAAALVAGAGGCSRDGDSQPRPKDPSAASAWARPPQVEAAVRDGASIVVGGRAGPDARVVLRGADGSATAVAADSMGRFEMRLASGAGDTRLTPEVQVGEDSAASPETLVLIRNGGPIVLLAAGQPTRRLDGNGVLDAVDSDGAALILSGRKVGNPPQVLIGGARTAVTVGRGGLWRATAPVGGPALIEVDGVRFSFPGGAPQSDFVPVRSGQGWRLTWPSGAGGRQTVWLPDRAP